MDDIRKTLTVYKASAGSGKTFRLSVEYIKLLMQNPMCHRHILAVTFTNKATEEMKTRILSQLYGIWKRLPDSRAYMDVIGEETGKSCEEMSRLAGTALHNIIHNYSYFRIETIDSFFQSVLRNLARELDLTANLRIELNDTQIEEQAVDDMVYNLGKDDEILKWILDYIKENMDEEKSWNVTGRIKEFGKNIFREFYKTNSDRLNSVLHEKDFFNAYTKRLHAMAESAKAGITAYVTRFEEAMQEHGYSLSDLSNGGSGAAGYFLKIRKGEYDDSIASGARVQKALNTDGAEAWTVKKAPQPLKDFAADVLSPLIHEAEACRQREWRTYSSAMLTLSHLNQLRLLNSIETKVRKQNMEHNRFLLSDTHTLLHSLIADSDSPFIFEKTGTMLRHIMIDEFQDTSTVQWRNFKVLLKECMSNDEEGGNLIVGDVKQSIYRWRAGDWRMLNNIEREVPHAREMLEVRHLKTNRRSWRRVTMFNNSFFCIAAEKECALLGEECGAGEEWHKNSLMQLRKAYEEEDVRQDVPDGMEDKGYVSVTLLPTKDATSLTLEHTAETVRTLMDRGARAKDIAILVRSNRVIGLIAEYFAKHMPEIKLVSDEAFRLDSSIAVNIIVTAMHSLTHPDDMLAKAFLAKAYQTAVAEVDNESADEMLTSADTTESALPHEFTSQRLQLLSLPIYELAERVYDIFSLHRIDGEDAYLYAFYDCLSDFLTNNSTDIDDFVDKWNESLHTKNIQASDTDGIRLLSIHKSKGLEYDHVIIPFCDWKIELPGVIWCSPEEEPYGQLPLVPVDFSRTKMLGSIYERDYDDEHLQNTVDNLNILYVSFTRAKASLHVIAAKGNKATRSYILSQTIADMCLDNCHTEGNIDSKDEVFRFTYGSLEDSYAPVTRTNGEDGDGRKTGQGNIFMPRHVERKQVKLHPCPNTAVYRQSNLSREFVEGEDTQQSYIKTGSLLHRLLASIETAADIDRAVTQLSMEGVLDESAISAKSIRSMLHKRIADSRVADWFSGRWRLYNECTILSYEPTTEQEREQTPGLMMKVRECRPDRVMTDGEKTVVVDFKFGNPKAAHTMQVREYISKLTDMGHDNVKGYLWYVYANDIVEVKP